MKQRHLLTERGEPRHDILAFLNDVENLFRGLALKQEFLQCVQHQVYNLFKKNHEKKEKKRKKKNQEKNTNDI